MPTWKLVNVLRLVMVLALMLPFSAVPPVVVADGNEIGDGTPGSCTEQAVADAIAAGGVWVFSCGAAPHTVVLTGVLEVETSVTLQATTPGLITLSGGGGTRVFAVADTGNLTLQGLIVSHGNAGNANGGAIFNAGALVLAGTVVRDSQTSAAGGGLYNIGGTVELVNAVVTGNRAGAGGGLAGDGDFYLQQSAVISNTADQGGGLHLDGTASIFGGTFEGNTAANGGGLYALGTALTISGTTFAHNRALGNGGNFGLGGGLYSGAAADLVGVTFSQNSAGLGGGLYHSAAGDRLRVEASTFNDNTATGTGGGLHVEAGNLELLNVTLSGNTANEGGGLYHLGGTADLAHVTVANNTAPIGAGLYRHAVATGALTLARSALVGNTNDNCAGAITSGDHNVSDDATCGLGGGSDQENTDPLLYSLAGNGGPTRTHLPAAGSPAIDAGPTGGCANYDQRGVARPVDAPCDAGAVEVDPFGPSLGCGGTFTPSMDALLEASDPNGAYGQNTSVGVTRSANGDQWTLLTFDLSGIPAGASLHHAELRLTVIGEPDPLPVPVAVQEADFWDEETVTWNSAPALGPAYPAQAVTPIGGVLHIDVTTAVNRQLNGEALPGGLALLPGAEADLTFAAVSREGAATAEAAPQLVITCAPPQPVVPANDTVADAQQASAASALAAASTQPLKLQFKGNAVRFGSFWLPLPPEAGSNEITRVSWFLDNYRALLRITNPAVEFQLDHISGDGEHVTFRQLHEGMPVFPANLLVHLDETAINSVSGGYVPGITLSSAPQLTAAQAEALALAAGGQGATRVGDTQLRYLSRDLLELPDGGLFLTWEVHVQGGSQPGDTFIDAHTGALRLIVPTEHDSYDLDLENGNGQLSSDLCSIWDNDNIGRDDLPPDSQAAWDNFNIVYHHWSHILGRDSYDDDGEQIEANINVNFPATVGNPNATYSACDLFFFSPGMATTDITGHEFTHAVDESEGKLTYLNQSGAIDESFADIFGYMVDSGDWLIGEGTANAGPPNAGVPGCSPAPAFRDLSNPPCYGQPQLFANFVVTTTDNFGVHTNSGIPNKAAYLIINGGSFNTFSITGLGLTKAEHLFYGVLINRMFPTASFNDLRNAAVYDAQLNAATGHLGFTAFDVCQVRNAYAAVGILPNNGDRNCDGEEDNTDTDIDGDGRPNAGDNCPNLWNPGQSDLDGNNVGDACDPDMDGDSRPNNLDNCPTVANRGWADWNGNNIGDACEDSDNDGWMDNLDNCDAVPNGRQENIDGDLLGDACDEDMDNDGWWNAADNCPRNRNPLQEDETEFRLGLGRDGVGDACDLCPNVSSSDNRDLDGDGRANPCDEDDDGDGYLDVDDNCPETFSRSQLDWDDDGIGFACDPDEQSSFGGILEGVNDQYLQQNNFFVPVPICPTCGADYLPRNHETVINLQLPIAFQARVVNSYGETVAKGSGSPFAQTLTISPLAYARTPLGGQQAWMAAGDLPLTELGPSAVRYYLVIEAEPGTDLGQAYPVTIELTEGVATEPVYLPLIQRTP